MFARRYDKFFFILGYIYVQFFFTFWNMSCHYFTSQRIRSIFLPWWYSCVFCSIQILFLYPYISLKMLFVWWSNLFIYYVLRQMQLLMGVSEEASFVTWSSPNINLTGLTCKLFFCMMNHCHSNWFLTITFFHNRRKFKSS